MNAVPNVTHDDSDTLQDLPVPKLLSPGQRLMSERMSRGLSVEQIAEELHLTNAQVDALEQDLHDQLPGQTYVRGYLRSYSRLLDLSEDSILESVRSSSILDSTKLVRHSINRQVRSGDRVVKLTSYALGLMIIALVFFWWQDSKIEPPLLVEQSLKDRIELTLNISEPQIKSEQINTADLPNNALLLADAAANRGQFIDELASSNSELLVDDAHLKTVQKMTLKTESVAAEQKKKENLSLAVVEPKLESKTISITKNKQTTDKKITTKASVPSGSNNKENSFSVSNSNAVVDSLSLNTISDVDKIVQPDKLTTKTALATLPPVTNQLIQNTQPALISAPDKLVLYFEQGSWVDVRDADNRRLLHQTVTKGRKMVLQGEPPFYVFLGNARGVRIEYQGQPFIFSSHKSGLFAKFFVGKSLKAAVIENR